MDTSVWNVERAAFLVAGVVVAIFAILALLVHPAFVWGDLFVGAMLVFFSLTGICPSAMLIARMLKR
jgi:hypothetical protein